MAYLTFALRVALGALLLVAGLLKAHDGAAATAASIVAYRIVPASVAAPLGAALPYVEIALGAYLVAGLFTRVAGWISAVQFVVFATAVGSLLVRHVPADCGCFGSAVATPPSWGHVALDVLLAVIAGAVARAAPGALSLDERLFAAPDAGGAFDPQHEA